MKCCCGWVCHYFWTCTSPALFIGWLRLWMSLASSVGDAQWKAMTQLARTADLFTCSEWEKLWDSKNAHKSFYLMEVFFRWRTVLSRLKNPSEHSHCFSAGHLYRPRFSSFPSPSPKHFREMLDFTELKEHILEVKSETNHSCPQATFPHERWGFCCPQFSAVKPEEMLGTAKAWFDVKIWLNHQHPQKLACSHVLCTDTNIHLGQQWLSAALDPWRKHSSLPPPHRAVFRAALAPGSPPSQTSDSSGAEEAAAHETIPLHQDLRGQLNYITKSHPDSTPGVTASLCSKQG